MDRPRSSRQRPTSDRVREAVFDMLGSIGGVAGWRVADLFAGTGAMGLEALSRGARSVVFVEQDSCALRVLRSNVAKVSSHMNLVISEVDERQGEAGVNAAGERAVSACRIVAGDVMSFIHLPDQFDLALCDPPYVFDLWAGLLGGLRARFAVLESDRELPIGAGWETIRVRRHGSAVVHLLRATSLAAERGQDGVRDRFVSGEIPPCQRDAPVGMGVVE